jgi:hypothetical protein
MGNLLVQPFLLRDVSRLTLLDGPDAILTGPTFETWLDSTL